MKFMCDDELYLCFSFLMSSSMWFAYFSIEKTFPNKNKALESQFLTNLFNFYPFNFARKSSIY